MNQKKILLSIIFVSLLISIETNAQTQYDIKLYYNFKHLFLDDESIVISDTFNVSQNQTFFGHFTPSILINTNRSVHEIEITDLNFERINRLQTISGNTNFANPVDGYKRYNYNLNIKYEYLFKLIGRDKKYGFMLSPSIEPYIQGSVNIPINSSAFKTKYFSFGGKFYIVPRGIISLGKRFYFDLNIPVEIIDVSLKRYYMENPSLPKDLRSSTNYGSEIFYNIFRIRFGIGIKL